MAKRLGDTVELRFTAPFRSTDNLPLQQHALHASLCRALEHGLCQPISLDPKELTFAEGAHGLIILPLPADLAKGTPRLLAYRIEFFSAAGKSAGKSDPAYTLAGAAPSPIEGLHAEGSRLGITLHWTPSATPSGDVILKRETLPPTPPATEWLSANSRDTSALDTSAHPDIPYKYIALRRITLQSGGHSLELRSAESSAVTITLRKTFPPPAPTGLSVLGYFASENSSLNPPPFAVDLVWQPINDAGLISPLAGYNVYRVPISTNKPSATSPERLNTSPTLAPSFHDVTANPLKSYRYTVTAVDGSGNESAGTSSMLDPTSTP